MKQRAIEKYKLDKEQKSELRVLYFLVRIPTVLGRSDQRIERPP
jgi:hypothetical protein